MTLTVILWLQSGRRFEQDEIIDEGGPPTSLQRIMLKGGRSMWGLEHDLAACPPIERLTFELTDPSFARITYRAGRRRFHYRETAGWRPREELEGSLCRDRDARFERVMLAIDKHHALIDAGAWPVHSCALPPYWPDVPAIAAHLFGYHNLGLE